MRSAALYAAPGSGVGHLTRACALGLRLARRGIACRVVTDSPYARGLARLSGLDIDRLPRARWISDFRRYVSELKPRLILLDTFPWGLRGEWKDFRPPRAEFVYLARRLKVREYLGALGSEWDRNSPNLQRVLVLEPLRDEHEALLARGRSEIHRLPGRIRLPERLDAPPIPPRLRELLNTRQVWLVVHSGPESEIHRLIALARKRIDRDPRARLVLVSPRPLRIRGVEWFEYHPARNLFTAARQVITAGGYNLVAETHEFQDKHQAIPFARKYDDQAGRLASPRMNSADGGDMAADRIAAWL